MNSYTKIAIALLLHFPLYALTLPEAVEHTLETNPQMKKSVSDYFAVKNDLDIASSGYRPTLDFKGAIGEETSDKERLGDEVTLTRTETQLIANQNLFEGFGTQYSIDEQEARVDASRFNAMQDANSIGLRATQVYLEVLREKKLLDLLFSNVKAHERIYKMIKQKTDSGLSRRSDLEQTQGRLALAYSNYISQQNNYQDALINFERVYGQIRSASDLELPSLPQLPASDKTGLIKVALKHSPTLMIEKANIKTQESRYEKDKNGFYPTLDLELAANWNDNIDGIERKDDSYHAMLRLNYNLYTGGNDESTRLKNMQLVTSVKESFNEQQRAVIEKVSLAFVAERLLANQVKCLKAHTEKTRQTADSYAKEYRLGRRTILDLLNTELEYNRAQQAVENAEFDRLLSRYRILEGTGVLPLVLKNSVAQRIDAELMEDIATTEQDNNIKLIGETDEFIQIKDICEDISSSAKASLSTNAKTVALSLN